MGKMWTKEGRDRRTRRTVREKRKMQGKCGDCREENKGDRETLNCTELPPEGSSYKATSLSLPHSERGNKQGPVLMFLHRIIKNFQS
jgi:hypothetical protein